MCPRRSEVPVELRRQDLIVLTKGSDLSYHDPSPSAVDQFDLCLTESIDVEEVFTAYESFDYDPD
jgi:hypothetical protein